MAFPFAQTPDANSMRGTQVRAPHLKVPSIHASAGILFGLSGSSHRRNPLIEMITAIRLVHRKGFWSGGGLSGGGMQKHV